MATYVSQRDGGKTSELGLFRWLKGFFRAGYVTAGNVTQRGAGANMSVDVQIGDYSLQATDRAFYGWNDTVQNVAVTASSPSNPRKDVVVAFVDLSVVQSVTSDNPNALKFLVVAGTPAGSPVDPTSGTIQTAVGAGNPYTILARIDVATSSTSVVNANLTDLRTPAALAVPYLYGGASNTKGHLVPNVADDTVALLSATQTFTNKTIGSTNTVQNVALDTNAAWTTWTPTFTNVTVGNGTLSAKYQQIGKTVKLRCSLVFGTTSAVSGDATFTLPVNAATYPGSANITPIGIAGFYDLSAVRNFQGHIAFSSTTVAKIVANAADASFLYGFVLSSTAPMTWATGDELAFTATYEAA